MSASSDKPAVPPSPTRHPRRAQSSGDQALFSNLIASRPQRDRRLAPWLIAGFLHVVIFGVLLLTDYGKSMRAGVVEVIRPILLEDDNPEPIREPERQAPAPEPVEPEPPRPPNVRERPMPNQVVPGLPDPQTITVPPQAEPQPSAGPAGPGPRSLRDRLAPRTPADPRLFGPVDGLPPPAGPDEVRARLAERINAYNDSLAAERFAEAKATDWTTTDKDGNRWGVSPGKLHLGKITLPLPLAFVPPSGRRDEVNAKLRSYSEIEQGASRAEFKDSFEERVKEIRKRKEAERAQKKRTVTN
jgi:hypothetical protein